MNDNSIHPGAKRFADAIALGHPIANTPAQALELVEIENREAASTAAEIVAESILCRECGKVGPQGRMSSGALIPICAACKRAADAAEEAKIGVLRTAIDTAFAPVIALAKKTTETREQKARSWARTELLAFVGSETACDGDETTWTPWFEEVLDAYLRGVKPDWAIDSEDVCERCGDIDMEREECELSRDPDDTGVGYRSVCRACGEGSEDEPPIGGGECKPTSPNPPC